MIMIKESELKIEMRRIQEEVETKESELQQQSNR